MSSFHQTELIRQLPRQLHRFTARERLPKFILGFDREHRFGRLSISCKSWFSFRVFQLGLAPDRSQKSPPLYRVMGTAAVSDSPSSAPGGVSNILRRAEDIAP